MSFWPESRRNSTPLMARKVWDVVIAGAGPAGMSAALILGRCCRSVLLCDTGTPRSWASKAMYGFLSRDGIVPGKFRRIVHDELAEYPNIKFHAGEVASAHHLRGGGFSALLGRKRRVRCRKLLIATGVYDHLPPIQGIEEFFGTSVFQCPYCDGWELQGTPIAVYGRGQRGFEMARAMTGWSRDLVLFTDGRSGLSREAVNQLRRNRIALIEDRVVGLAGRGGKLTGVELRGGRVIPRRAFFFDTPSSGQSRLAESLGCQFMRHGGVRCGRYEATSVPGVFVAGNIIRDVQLAIVAAAEGARAAFGINRALTREDFETRVTGSRRVQHPPLGSSD